MRKYVIERDIPKVGSMTHPQLCEAAKTSNRVLGELAPRVQWIQSYVAADKTFCVYLAENADVIHEHAKRSGFPATKITEIRTIIDPTTAASPTE